MARWRGLVDAVAEANERLLADGLGERRAEMVRFLLERQIVVGRDAGLFEPTPADDADRRLPTGERLRTKLATRHILSHEATRILHVAGGEESAAAVGRARRRIAASCYAAQHCMIGECAASYVGYIRLLNALDPTGPDLALRVRALHGRRDGRGRWTGLPFYYTLCVLSELRLATAAEEVRYALGATRVERPEGDSPQARVRRAVVQRAALGRI
ncbi:MAG: hypothetical protein AB1778_03260 [Candidatus Bipolaricaulota bacterium]